MLIHGESIHGKETKLYRRWTSIRSRTKSLRTKERWYRAANITVCQEWLESYDNFKRWSLANGFREDLTLDRIDTDKDYSPENCRWVDRTVQMHNRRDNSWIVAFGESKLSYDWIKDERCVVSQTALRGRMQRGWTGEAAISTPALTSNGK